MVADKQPKPTGRNEFEIAIVCTRALEYDAVCLLFDEFWDTDGDSLGRARGDPNTYTTGCMGKYNIVVVLLCSSGKANAAGAAASLRSSYPCIELLLLTGICEGVPDANGEELLLGDVVVSETVIQYDLGTQHVVGFKEKDTLEDRHGRANKNIRNFITNVKTEIGYQRIEEKVATFLEKIQSRASETKYQRRRKTAPYMYPGSTNDILFKSSHCHRHYNSSQCVCADYYPNKDSYAVCDDAKISSCEQTGCGLSSLNNRDRLQQKNLLENGGDLKSAQIPSIFFGRFGSGDTVFNSGVHRDLLAKSHGIIAFEMEGAGVWDELPCIIVKGVSDYGDSHKTKKWAEWQNFAAATAASVSRALIERYPQTDKPPVIEPKTDKLPTKLHENKACLDALFITNPEHDKKRIEDTKGGLLLDAYIWIIRNESFVQWFETPETRLLWIKGDPGKGKTMLLCGIINELQIMKPGCNIYYFLCQETDVRLNNASAVLRGLLHMMIVQQPSLISYIKDEYGQSGKSAFEGINSWVVLSRIFEQILRDDLLKKPIFIIDALDECVADLTQLLGVMVRNTQSSSRVKWLVSSRNEADIQEALAAAENKSTVSLELNAESVSTAIATYIRHKVQLLADKKGYNQPTRERVERYLSDNASGTFLWVALVCALLEKVPRSDPLPKSADFPPALDQLYERMISRVCNSSISDIGIRVLAIATVTHRPLTKEELIPLIKKSHDNEIIPPAEYDWEDMLGHCGSFLTMRSDTIYFIHQSTKDFLIKEGSQRIFPKGMEYVHREILEVSIVFMRSILRKDMYNLVDPAFAIDNLSQHTLSDDPLIPIKYGCVYWIDHFEHSIPKCRIGTHDSSKNHELIHAFLKEKFIYWLEALGLLKCISKGIAGMQRLEQLVSKSETSGLLELVKDARKFVQMFEKAIINYPLQVYVSALIFSPTQSIIRYQFKKEVPKWIQTLPNGKSEWTPSSRVYECSDCISNLAVSYCGTWIAFGQVEAAIIIMETYSGNNIRALDAYSGVSLTEFESSASMSFLGCTLVCFSPWNTEELVSSCYEHPDHSQLLVWDITSGKVSQKLRTEDRVYSISYLNSVPHTLGYISTKWEKKTNGKDHNNGTIIASIWNTKTGHMIERIQLHGPEIYISPSTSSSTNGHKVAWCRESDIEIITINTSSTIHIPMDDSIRIRHMDLSPDGSFLALRTYMSTTCASLLSDTLSAPFIHILTLVDASSGEIRWSFQTETDITDIAFSPDGNLLAMATYEGIELLSTISGKCLRKIIMSSQCLIFSSDGSKMLSAYFTTLSVIDISQESFVGTSSGDNFFGEDVINRYQVFLSPNGRLVGAALANELSVEVVEIGSTKSPRFLRALGLPQKKINHLLFSPDSEKLLIISEGNLILWDISSEPSRQIFLWENPPNFFFLHYSCVFSSDSKRLATALTNSNDYSFSIQVWDSGSGKCLMYLVRDAGLMIPYLLCFSLDNGQLAISYFDEVCIVRVEIWDIASASAMQSTNFSWLGSDNHFQTSNSDPVSLNSSKEEDQENWEDEKATERVEAEMKTNKKSNLIEQPKYYIQEFYFIDNGHLILDLGSPMGSSHQNTGIRVALRTRMGPEWTGETINKLRFRESKIYELEFGSPWIRFNGKRIVWIPPQYRTDAIRIERNCVMISHLGGSLSIFQFCHSELAKQIPSPHTPITEKITSMPNVEAYTYLRELDDGWNVVYRDMNAPDDKMLHKIESVDEIKDTSEEIAYEDIMEHYSYWKWTILGF